MRWTADGQKGAKILYLCPGDGTGNAVPADPLSVSIIAGEWLLLLRWPNCYWLYLDKAANEVQLCSTIVQFGLKAGTGNLLPTDLQVLSGVAGELLLSSLWWPSSVASCTLTQQPMRYHCEIPLWAVLGMAQRIFCLLTCKSFSGVAGELLSLLRWSSYAATRVYLDTTPDAHTLQPDAAWCLAAWELAAALQASWHSSWE